MTRRRTDGGPTVRQRLRYRLDNILARGTWAVLAWLGIVTLLVVLLAAVSLRRVGVTFSGSTNSGLFEDFWQSLLRTLDTGTMAGDTGFRPRAVALAITLFGVLVAGTLIGVIASGVEAQIDRMKRGRSTVVERDHIVVLGTSRMLPETVGQLALANVNRPTAIVVLADRDSTEMSDEVRRVARDTRGSRFVFRTGDPTRVDDLALVRLDQARTIIVLNGDGDSTGDARAIHTVLAVRSLLDASSTVPIIVVLDDVRIGQAVDDSGGGTVHPLIAAQAVARNAAFILREPGLGDVMSELIDFEDSSIYHLDVPDIAGRPFGEIALRFADVRPIGLLGADGRARLNPDPTVMPSPGDRLVVVADDDHPPTLSTFADDHDVATMARADQGHARGVEHLVVVGWNGLGPALLAGWAMTASPDSTLEITYDPAVVDRGEIAVPDLPIASVTLTANDGGVTAIWPADDATTVVFLSYHDHLSRDQVDSRTLLELMTVQHRLGERREAWPRLVVELLDAANAPLARSRHADEVIVSPAMASQLLAQLADQPERRAVFLAFFAVDGASIHLVAPSRYGLGGTVSGREVARAALAHGAIAIGWRRAGELRLNPHEHEQVTLGDGDHIVIVG